MFRRLLAKHARQAAVPDARVAGSHGSESEQVMTAADLTAQGVRQQGCGAYSDAQRSLMRAIELEHDNSQAHHNLGLVYLEQGHTEDAVDCFQLAVHFCPRLVSAYADLSAALLVLRRYSAAEDACRTALELDPVSPIVWLRLGHVLKARGELADAAAAFRAASEHDSSSPDAACQLALALFRLGQYEESYAAHTALIAKCADFAPAHHNLGLLQLETGDAAAAMQSFQRALQLRPGTAETRTCIAHALRDLGRLDEAIAAYDEVLAECPQFGDALINRCYSLLMRGDYVAGWSAYEQRFDATQTLLKDFGISRWRGEPFQGKRVLVLAEQGIGDEIMFASCIPDLQAIAGDCLIQCSRRLTGLFARSFPQASVHGADKNEDDEWLRALPAIDFQVPIGSLPLHFRRAHSQFPAHGGYLRAEPARIEAWRRTLTAPTKAARIGIAWRGGTLRNRQYLRSSSLADWVPIIAHPHYEFVSLQYGDCTSELQALGAQRHLALRDAGNAAADLDELAALISALDLVISVDNTVAHLAGALGARVWVLLPFSAEWRYLRSANSMPWYSSARLFRQPRPRDWAAVMDRVARALQTEFAACSSA